jgi:magnesium transporter
VVWLSVLLVANTFTAAVIKSQESLIQQVAVLASFIPLLIGTGGNVGAQSSTVVIRGLNTDELKLREAFKVIRREAIAGAFLGLMLGLVVTGVAYLAPDISPGVAISVGCSLVAISILASSAGAALPILFQSLGFDPALMSAPFITTVVDVFGVLIYLSLARRVLQI